MSSLDIASIKKTIETRCKGITRVIFANENIDALKIIIERKDNGGININITSFGIRDNKEDPFYKQSFGFKIEKQKRNINPKSKLNLLQGKKKQPITNVVNKPNEKQDSVAEVANSVVQDSIVPSTMEDGLNNDNKKIDIKLNNIKILKLNKYINKYKEHKKNKNIKKYIKKQIKIKKSIKANNKKQHNNTDPDNSIDPCKNCKVWENKYIKIKNKYKKIKKDKNKIKEIEDVDVEGEKHCYQCSLDNGVYKYENYEFNIYRVEDNEGKLVNISINRCFEEEPEVEYYETDGEDVVITGIWNGKKIE